MVATIDKRVDRIPKVLRLLKQNPSPDTSNRPYIVMEEEIEYPTFMIPKPNFGTNRSRRWFFKAQAHREHFEQNNPPPVEALRGSIWHIQNGTYAMPHDCGYKSTVHHVLHDRKVSRSSWRSCLIPLLVPDGDSFQHFTDGVLPKIMQVYHIITKECHCKLVLYQPRVQDKHVHDMLAALDIREDQLVFVRKGAVGPFGADKLIYTCRTPPIHPVLWREARRALWRQFPPVEVMKKDKEFITILSRDGKGNGGRRIINEDDMYDQLKQRYGEHIVKRVVGSALSFNQTIHIFQRTRLFVGPHGGGMYNTLFAPEGSAVVEFFPTTENGKLGGACPNIF